MEKVREGHRRAGDNTGRMASERRAKGQKGRARGEKRRAWGEKTKIGEWKRGEGGKDKQGMRNGRRGGDG